MAANPRGEEKSPAPSRGITPARAAAIAALAVVVIALGVILFGGGGEHKYTLLFQNASQLVPDNQVLIGGQPVGSVESIGLTDDNLAEVKISSEQELHEGTTAVIRATSLSGVANHYVSISPGPNDEPALDEGATLGPLLDDDPGRPRPALQHLPARGPPAGSNSSSRAAPRSTPATGPTPTAPTNTSARASTGPTPSSAN